VVLGRHRDIQEQTYGSATAEGTTASRISDNSGRPHGCRSVVEEAHAGLLPRPMLPVEPDASAV
jgi:hypothetical protein